MELEMITPPGRQAEDNRVSRGTSSKNSRATSSTPRIVMTTGTLMEKTPQELDDDFPGIARLVTFEDKRQLLRASRLVNVLHNFAEVFAESNGGGCERIYGLSEEVGAISAFISHNWEVPRFKKFLCLVLYWNFYPAFAAALVATAAIVVASDAGLLPRIAAGGRQGVVGALCVGPIFLVIAFFGHNMRFLCGWCCHTPMVFLDKTCVHQVDLDLKKECITKLGAFIRHSSTMLVIYSPVYLTKLWTVYEVACFLALHPSSRMQVIPTHLPLLVLGGALISYASGVIIWCAEVMSDVAGPYITVGVTILEIFPYMAVLRYAGRSKAGIQERMMKFRVEECTCLLESDRPIVYENISLLMRAIGEVDFDATEEAVLSAFNMLVRKRVPSALLSSVGRVGYSYCHALAWSIVSYVPKNMEERALGENMSPQAVLAHRLYRLIWAFVLFPVIFASMSWLCGFCVQLRGLREVAFLLGVFLYSATSGILLHELIFYPLYLGSLEGAYQEVCMISQAVLLITMTPVVVALFNVQRFPWQPALDDEE